MTINNATIYDQHRAHTKRVSACAILHNGQHVASVTIAYPKDGAGRLYAYAHWLGKPMVRGHANGYGYDKRTAALSVACRANLGTAKGSPTDATEALFWESLSKDGGEEWTNKLLANGFAVCRVC